MYPRIMFRPHSDVTLTRNTKSTKWLRATYITTDNTRSKNIPTRTEIVGIGWEDLSKKISSVKKVLLL